MDQLGSKDSSRDFQLNCVISYFFIYIYYFMYGSKDWCDGEKVKKISIFRVHLNKALAWENDAEPHDWHEDLVSQIRRPSYHT
jgi:hypothetical protein